MKNILRYAAYRTAARSGLEIDFSTPMMRGLYHSGEEYKSPPELLLPENQSGEFCRLTLPIPVVPAFLTEGGHLARLLNISDGQLQDIITYKLALTPDGLALRSELGDACFDEHYLYGGAAVEHMLSQIELSELEYELERTLINEPDHPDRATLSARLDTVRQLRAAGIDTGFFVTRVLPVPVEIQKIAQSPDLDLTEYELSDTAYVLSRRIARTERAMKLNAPRLVIHNEHRMITEAATAYLGAVLRAGISLSNPSYCFEAVLNNLSAVTGLKVNGDTAILTVPMYFRNAEGRPAFSLVLEGAGYRISDRGFALDYLKYDLGLDVQKYSAAILRIAEEKELELTDGAITAHLPGLANPVAMVHRLSSYLSAITLVAHIDILV